MRPASLLVSRSSRDTRWDIRARPLPAALHQACTAVLWIAMLYRNSASNSEAVRLGLLEPAITSDLWRASANTHMRTTDRYFVDLRERALIASEEAQFVVRFERIYGIEQAYLEQSSPLYPAT